jgi:hypothetical protein
MAQETRRHVERTGDAMEDVWWRLTDFRAGVSIEYPEMHTDAWHLLFAAQMAADFHADGLSQAEVEVVLNAFCTRCRQRFLALRTPPAPTRRAHGG